MAKTTQNKQVFSISQKYIDIIEILEKIENKSEFICQAILEKSNGMNKVEDDVVLEEKIKKVIKSMMNENIFLVAGNPNNISSVPIQRETEFISDKKEEPVENQDDDEDEDYLKSVLQNM